MTDYSVKSYINEISPTRFLLALSAWPDSFPPILTRETKYDSIEIQQGGVYAWTPVTVVKQRVNWFTNCNNDLFVLDYIQLNNVTL